MNIHNSVKLLEDEIFTKYRRNYLSEKCFLDNLVSDYNNLQTILTHQGTDEETMSNARDSIAKIEAIIMEKVNNYGLAVTVEPQVDDAEINEMLDMLNG